MLFSEPKIPQYNAEVWHRAARWGFSALQRAENSSTLRALETAIKEGCFSALQRAENSSMLRVVEAALQLVHVSVLFSEPKIPQFETFNAARMAIISFSALQRAENSSISTLAPASIHISDRDDHASSFLSLPGASP